MGLEVCSKGKQAAFFMYYFFTNSTFLNFHRSLNRGSFQPHMWVKSKQEKLHKPQNHLNY